MIGHILGRYRVLERIGKGGMGEVYLAEDTSLGRKVALKFLNPDLQTDPAAHKRFMREARSAAALDHPFICNVHEVDQTETNQDYIVMEFVPGQSLNKILAEGPLPLLDSLQILQEVAEALQEAHEKGIVHRDLKPSNIMVTTGGHSKVMDFGLAKRIEQAQDLEITSVLTEKGKVIGTPAYMSPEQLQGKELGVQSDIFSLGVIALQMLTGRHPFHRPNLPATIGAILHESPETLNETTVPDELKQIFHRMLKKDPADRYPNCAELLEDLRDAVRVLSYPTVPILSPFVPQRSWGKHRKKILSAATATALLSGLIFFEPIMDRLQLTPLPKNPTLAVLPFSATDHEEHFVAFVAGLNEATTTTLSRLSLTHPFNVVPANVVKQAEVVSPKLVGQKLGANLALLGSFHLAEGLVNIKLELTAGGSNRRLRVASLSGPYEEPTAVQSTLIERTLEMLESKVAPSDRQILSDVGFRNTRAYLFYLRGLGYQHGTEQNLDSAIAAYRTAQSFEGRSALTDARLGLSLLEKCEAQHNPSLFEEGVQHCLSAQTLDENSFEANLCLGEVALERGMEETALIHFEKAYAREPTNDAILDRLELLYERAGRSEKVESLYQLAIGRQPGYWRLRSRLAVFYYHNAQYEEAIEQLGRVVELAPEYGSAYNTLGAIYASLFCWEQAISMFQKARESMDREVVDTNMATAYFFAGRLMEAVQEAEKALLYLGKKETKKDEYINYGNLADIYYWSPGGGYRERAEYHYRRAIFLAEKHLEYHPGDLETLGYLALYHAMLLERETALDYLEGALHPNPTHTKNLYRAALVYRVLGNTQQSLSFLEKYFRSGGNPRNPAQDPAFEELRSQRGYQELAEQYPDLASCPE